MASARLELRIWTDGDIPLPEPLGGTFAPEAERIGGMLAEGYTSGDIHGDNFRGWWTIVIDDLSEAEQAERGATLAAVLGLKRAKGHRDRWATSWGSKTDLGLFKTIKRIIQEGK